MSWHRKTNMNTRPILRYLVVCRKWGLEGWLGERVNCRGLLDVQVPWKAQHLKGPGGGTREAAPQAGQIVGTLGQVSGGGKSRRREGLHWCVRVTRSRSCPSQVCRSVGKLRHQGTGSCKRRQWTLPTQAVPLPAVPDY